MLRCKNLKSLVVRIRKLEDEKADISAAIRDVYAEAKGNGFEPKAIREIIKIRRTDPYELNELEAVLHLYKQALGMAV